MPILRGLKDSLVIAVGYFPVALSFGVLAVQLGLAPWQALVISAIVYAGASQFAMVALIGAGASPLTVVGVVALMNLRHAFYGPALLHRLPLTPRSLPKAVLALGLSDEVFAIAVGRLDGSEGERSDVWLAGLELGAYLSWLSGTMVGSLLGAALVHQSAFVDGVLQFALPALFFALLLELRHSSALVAAATTAATLAVALVAPNHVAMLAGMLVGIGVTVLRRWSPRYGG